MNVYRGFEIIDKPFPGVGYQKDTLVLFKGVIMFTKNSVRKLYFDPTNGAWPVFNELIAELDKLSYMKSLKDALTFIQNKRVKVKKD